MLPPIPIMVIKFNIVLSFIYTPPIINISLFKMYYEVKNPHNTKRILNFDDLRLVDENGTTWNKINDGETAKQISKDESIIYLQSNYFRNPKKLSLVINKIQA